MRASRFAAAALLLLMLLLCVCVCVSDVGDLISVSGISSPCTFYLLRFALVARCACVYVCVCVCAFGCVGVALLGWGLFYF